MSSPKKKVKNKLLLKKVRRVRDFSTLSATQRFKRKKDPKEEGIVTITTTEVDKEAAETEVEVNTNKIQDKTTIGGETRRLLVRCCAPKR